MSRSNTKSEVWIPDTFVDWNPLGENHYVSDWVVGDKMPRQCYNNPKPEDQLMYEAPWAKDAPNRRPGWGAFYEWKVEELCHCTHEDNLETIVQSDGFDLSLEFVGCPKQSLRIGFEPSRVPYYLENVGPLSWWHVFLPYDDVINVRSQEYDWKEEGSGDNQDTWKVAGFGNSGMFSCTSRYGQYCCKVTFDDMMAAYAKCMKVSIDQLLFMNGGTLAYQFEVQHNVIVATPEYKTAAWPDLLMIPPECHEYQQFSVQYDQRRGLPSSTVKMRSSTDHLNFYCNGRQRNFRKQYYQHVALAFWLPQSKSIQLPAEKCQVRIVNHEGICVRREGERRCRPDDERSAEATAMKIQTNLNDGTLKEETPWVKKVLTDNNELF
ncbi:uncharacterized protein LOC134191174 [Corticium candelabrum]|uniref:uncharacterized protein LOC134191174 n=1 Tax=Corticium candelabrum TaxID=121492 RepID=UPI002E274626|nr:uncharacterized protein LOC134191174 [Corticium candelabrum]